VFQNYLASHITLPFKNIHIIYCNNCAIEQLIHQKVPIQRLSTPQFTSTDRCWPTETSKITRVGYCNLEHLYYIITVKSWFCRPFPRSGVHFNLGVKISKVGKTAKLGIS
jgi:hypothetical protein